MKIAISCQGNTLESPVDPRFGRAQGFLVYDLDTNNFEYANNDQNLNIAQGAGIQTAQNVAKTGAKAVITGNVGPKAFSALSQGILPCICTPTGLWPKPLPPLKMAISPPPRMPTSPVIGKAFFRSLCCTITENGNDLFLVPTRYHHRGCST